MHRFGDEVDFLSPLLVGSFGQEAQSEKNSRFVIYRMGSWLPPARDCHAGCCEQCLAHGGCRVASLVDKKMFPGTWILEFESQLHHLLVVPPGVSYLISLCLGFLSVEKEWQCVSLLVLWGRWNEVGCGESLEQCWACGRCSVSSCCYSSHAFPSPLKGFTAML